MALDRIKFNIASFNDADADGNNYYAGIVYEIFNSNDTLADIYSDAAGANPINQDGISNKSNSSGEAIFYISSGNYYIKVEGKIDLFDVLSDFDTEHVSVNNPTFNRNSLAIGVGESSSVGASWDYTKLDGVGFVSSNTTKNHAWLAPADTFQYVDIETPFGVIIGDSIAEGHGSPDRHGRLETGSVPIYNLSLPNVEGQPSWYLSQKTNMHWYNQGIGGQTTTQVLARFRRDALGETVAVGDGRPDTTLTRAPYCVWVNAGINDISYGDDIETTKSNLLAMCELARNAGIVVGFNTCGPHNSHDATEIQKQKELQDFILTELPKRGAYTFDFRTWFENPISPDSINPSLNADNVHPSGAGYLSYVSELIKQSAAPIIMQQLCFESKNDPDNKPSSLIDSKLVNLEHVADGVYSSAEFSNQEAQVSCNFDMTNTTQLRATITGDNFPVTGADWITVSRVYGVFGNQKLPSLSKPPVFATIKHTNAGGFEIEESEPLSNFIDVSIVSTTHLRVRFTRKVSQITVASIGTTYPYEISSNLIGAPRRECEIYVRDRATGLAIDPATASGLFFISVKAM